MSSPFSLRTREKHRTPLAFWAAQYETERADDLADAPVPLRYEGKRYTYTVMADNGVGEFLWGKESDDSSCLVGGNIYSLMEEGWYPADISPDLFIDLCMWSRKYMQAAPRDWFSEPWELDWDAFNREGLELARRLKQELGDSADVQYVRPWNDPDRRQGEATAITLPPVDAGSGRA